MECFTQKNVIEFTYSSLDVVYVLERQMSFDIIIVHTQDTTTNKSIVEGGNICVIGKSSPWKQDDSHPIIAAKTYHVCVGIPYSDPTKRQPGGRASETTDNGTSVCPLSGDSRCGMQEECWKPRSGVPKGSPSLQGCNAGTEYLNVRKVSQTTTPTTM